MRYRYAQILGMIYTAIITLFYIGYDSQFSSEFFSFMLIVPAIIAMSYVLIFQRIQMWVLAKGKSDHLRITFIMPLLLPLIFKISIWINEPLSLIPHLRKLDLEHLIYVALMFIFNVLIISLTMLKVKHKGLSAKMANAIRTTENDSSNTDEEKGPKKSKYEYIIITFANLAFIVVSVILLQLITNMK